MQHYQATVWNSLQSKQERSEVHCGTVLGSGSTCHRAVRHDVGLSGRHFTV